MDPNKVLTKLIEAAYAGDYRELREAAADLTDWLRRGGFLPSVEGVEALPEPVKHVEVNTGRPICPNCLQWADSGDCYNQCAKRGFA